MRLILFITISLLCYHKSICQNTEFVNLLKYSQSDGLSSPNIRKISKDYLGFMWIATQDGLNKFDGKQFTIFNSNTKTNDKLTLGSDFHDFFITKNLLWAVTSNGGLNKINVETNKVLATYNITNEKLVGDWLHSIENFNSFIYMTTNRGQIIRFNTKTNKTDKIFQVKSNIGREIVVQKTLIIDSTIWVFTSNNGMILYKLGAEKPLEYIMSLKKSRFSLSNVKLNDILDERKDNKLLIASDIGILEVDIKSRTVDYWKQSKSNLEREIAEFPVSTISRCRDKVIFTSLNDLYETSPSSTGAKKLRPVNIAENKQWFQGVLENYSDDENIFLGNQTGFSVIHYFKSPFISYSRSATNYNIKIGHNTHLCISSDSLIYSCASEGGIYGTNIYSGEIKKIDTSQIYFQIIKIDEKSFLFSGEKKMVLWKNNRIQDAINVFPSLKAIDKDFIIASITYKDSIVLLASQNGKGIYLFNLNTQKTSVINKTTVDFNLPDLVINNFYKNRNEEIVVVCDRSVTVINFQKKTSNSYQLNDPVTGNPLGIIMDCVEIGGSYYFAVYGRGVVVTDKFFTVKRILSSEQGITNNGIYEIFHMADSMFICSSNNGLYIYNLSTNKTRKLSSNEGLQSDNFEETSGFETDDKIVFGGENGFTVVYPKRIFINKISPALYFTGINILLPLNKQFDTTNVKATSYNISNTALQTTVFFSGINFASPDHTYFSYKIKELQNEWIDNNTQSYITLIGLSPGTYHLQVKAANEDGVWSEPKELILIFEPKWYQTWWFKLLVLLSTASIIYAFYRYRINQIKKQHEIRKNIATDLHDDLGSTLNSVKVFTNLAISGIKQEESLQQVKDNLTEATMSLRDMIWVLDDSLDTVDELITRLKQFAIPVATASNIETIIKSDRDVNNRQLTKEEKRNLFLICKEAINNSIKYSGATQINVDITASGKKAQIVVADNGKGFNVDEVKKGYGLKNMQYRAGQIRFAVTLTSILNKGTQVILKPL